MRAGFKDNAGCVSLVKLCSVAAKVGHEQQATELNLTLSEAADVLG